MEQESYDFFTGAIEDLTLPEAADGANGEGGRGEVGEGEGSQEELDTSALLEQQVCKFVSFEPHCHLFRNNVIREVHINTQKNACKTSFMY